MKILNEIGEIGKYVSASIAGLGLISLLGVGYQACNENDLYKEPTVQKVDYQKPVAMAHPEGLVFKVGNKYFLDKDKDKTLDEVVILKDSKTGEKDILKKGDTGFERYAIEFENEVLPKL